jgi:hypothetical protein
MGVLNPNKETVPTGVCSSCEVVLLGVGVRTLPLSRWPENRVYVSVDGAEDFLHSFLASLGGRVVSDEATASGIEIGRPQITFANHLSEDSAGVDLWKARGLRHRRQASLPLWTRDHGV